MIPLCSVCPGLVDCEHMALRTQNQKVTRSLEKTDHRGPIE
jgi:hypothetical protein